MPPEGSDLIFDHRHNAADRVLTWWIRGWLTLSGTARGPGTPLLSLRPAQR
jgi:hypothetical protein